MLPLYEFRIVRALSFVLSIPIISLLVSYTLLAQTSAQVVISERTGNTIDAIEREYFGLFPQITDFVSAEAHPGSGEQIDLVIRRGSASDTSITISSAAAHEMGRYLDNLESMFLGKDSVDWSLLRKLVHPYRPFDEYNTLTVTDRNGDRYTASLLYAADSVLILWPKDSLYDWRKLSAIARPFHASQIMRIERPNAYYPGLAAGVFVGGTASYIINALVKGKLIPLGGSVMALFGITALGGYVGKSIGFDAMTEADIEKYREVIPDLKGKAYFYSVPPPEVTRLMNQISQPVTDILSPIVKDPPPVEETDYNSHFHAGFGAGDIPTTFGTYKLNTVGRISESEIRSESRTLNADVEYSLLQRLKVGAIVMKNTPVTRDSNNVEYMDFTAADLFVDLVLVPAGALEIHGLELAVGAGTGVTMVEVNGVVTSPYIGSKLSTPYSVKGSAFGFYVRASLDYYLFKHLSVQARLDQQIVSSITVPEAAVNSTVGIVRSVEEHELNPSFITAVLALRLHF